MGIFTKDELKYTLGKKFFTYNGEVINFDAIKEIDSKTTTETKNSVYIKRELVVKLYFEKGGLHLKSDTKEIEKYKLLSELIDNIQKYKGIAPAGIPYPPSSKKESNFWFYFKVLFVLFGINGLSEMWFDISLFRHTEPFETFSTLSGIFFAVIVFVTPMMLLVHKFNMRKLQKEDDLLSGRESRVRDIDFTNFLIVILVIGLVYLIYIQVE